MRDRHRELCVHSSVSPAFRKSPHFPFGPREGHGSARCRQRLGVAHPNRVHQAHAFFVRQGRESLPQSTLQPKKTVLRVIVSSSQFLDAPSQSRGFLLQPLALPEKSVPGPLIAWREADAPPLRVFQPMVSVGMRTDTLRVEFSLRLRCSAVTACVQNRIIGRAPTGPVLP